MADHEEEATADEKEQSVRDSQELIEEQEKAEVYDEAKHDIQGLEDRKQVASGVLEFVQEGDGEQESKPQEAAAVEEDEKEEVREQEEKPTDDEEEKAAAVEEDEKEEVREQEEKPSHDGEEKAEITEVEGVQADEENVQHEYIDDGDEATLEALEKENEMEQVEGGTVKADDMLPAAQGPIIGEEQVQGHTLEAGDMLPVDPQRLEVTTPGSLVISIDSEPTGEQDKMVTDRDELAITDEPQMQRTELIEKYYDAVAKRNKLQSQNFQVQNKLFDYFRRKKSDEVVDLDKNVSEYEQRYLKFMAQIEDLRKLDSIKRDNYHVVIEETKERCMEKKSRADLERSKFIELKQNVALHSISSQTGQPLRVVDIEQYVDNELRKEQEVVHMRLENIILKNKMKKNEQQIKLKEQVSEGLHLIDFEQLKIENQTYNEKIEERNEELLKFRKKITNTVQILTHVKEKLQFVQAENLVKNNDLKIVDATLAQSRDILSRTKKARDSLKIDNSKLQQKCGFLGKQSLLKDFEEQKDENIELQSKLDELKMKHAQLSLHCTHIRQKVEQTRKSLA